MNNKTKGYLYGCAAAVSYGMNPLFALPLYSNGLGANDVLLLRYVFALLILYVMIRMRGRSLKVEKKALVPLSALGVLMGLSSLLLFQSYNLMPAGIASTLLFVYPLMVALIMALVFHQKTGVRTWICIAVAIFGIALLYKPNGQLSLDGVGTLLVMLSALSYAIYLVWVNRPAFKDIPTLVLTFYVILFGLIIFVVGAAVHGKFILPSTPLHWVCAFALGLFPTAVSLLCTTRAIQYIGSTNTAILGALEPLTALFFGLLVFGESLTGREVLGLALILVAVTLVVGGENVSTAILRMRKMFPSLSSRRVKKPNGDQLHRQ